ncbi:glycosyltransferase [Cognatiyoonia sp. IB215446]|uniref:glycosyltransferase family 2 protein n=1 Tax=Cognatiyoonia sp. IB215446 TaxID=3097355 RepID=UPI002A0C8CE7|nr:glycosyltransferase [Cognatiyoonia sp. IB215446]MDX8349212.1 glycosyltransferase [Cognatiyoonia sp. IB215446]
MTAIQKVDLAIFAHNEEHNIGAVLTMLAKQSIFENAEISVRIIVLANGCADQTVSVAQTTIRELPHGRHFEVCDLAIGGKSRAWNAFVHETARKDADHLIFCDADIDIPEPDTLDRLLAFVQADPKRVIASSRPVKDIVYAPDNLNYRDKMIAAAGGTLDNWRKAVCGQLYIMRAATARSFHLPIGLPVEDGFVRAMTLTDLFRHPEDLDLIDGDNTIFHVYASERGIRALIRHQVRIVIGSAINAIIFDVVRQSDTPNQLLREAAEDDDWLARTCKSALPRRYGYVPVHFLTKRLSNLRAQSLKRKAILLVGFGFDLVVYVIAQFKMARGTGAGHW